MQDPRVLALAKVLVRYSTRVRRGDVCVIKGPIVAEPLLRAIYEEVLKAGGHPITHLAMDEQAASFYKYAKPHQLTWLSPTARWEIEHADCSFAVMADTNPGQLEGLDPKRQHLVENTSRPIKETMLRRSATGDYRWVLTMYPTQAFASKAGLSLTDYADFYYRACLADRPDPVGAWKKMARETTRLARKMQGHRDVHLEGPGTNLRLSIAGRKFIPGTGTHNLPDGEFFTGPVENSAEGFISFQIPAGYRGRSVSGVRLEFKRGKVVKATARTNQAFLHHTLQRDRGASFLGELGIGTNYGITKGTGQILLNEKIGGTIHLALGSSYPETGGRNQSTVHWDMICDLRKGGKITVDGKVFQKNGKFV